MNFEAAAKEAFQILRSYDYEVLLYNDEGEQVFEPEEARRMFAKPDNMLLSIVDDGEDSSVRLYVSKSTDINSILGLCTALRVMATKYSMVFNVKETGRDLTPRDFTTKASVTETKEKQMKILEGMYGTSRSSYLKLENARMIVRHSDRINENMLGARGRNIDSIYIENGVGERYLFPAKQLAPARAMTHHVNQGGNWADPVGQQIARMAQDFANLGVTARHIYYCGGELPDEAQGIRESLRENMRAMRRVFECVCRKTRYEETARHLEEQATTLTEGEGKDYSEKITELCKALNTESVSLAENVLRSVAEALEEGDKRYKMGPPEHTIAMIGVTLTPGQTQRVSKEAWDALKQGRLDLLAKPDFSTLPKFKTRRAQIAFLLRGVAEKAKDDSMANLLGHVADQILDVKDKELYNRLRMVADRALHAAGVRFEAPGSEGVPKTESVVEYAKWLDSFSTERLLETADECEIEEACDEDAELDEDFTRDMDKVGSVGAPGEDPLAPAEKITDRPAQLRDFGHAGPLSPEEIAAGSGTKKLPPHDPRQLAKAVTRLNPHEPADPDSGLPQTDFNPRRLGKTMGRPEQSWYAAEDIEPEGDLELSSEDILLPADGAQDLIDDTTKTPVDDDGHEDRNYVSRLSALAGIQRPY